MGKAGERETCLGNGAKTEGDLRERGWIINTKDS